MKNFVLCLVFVVLSTTAFSQVTVRPGVRAGANLASLTNSNTDTKVDAYLGGFAAIKFVHFYTLQPEINYSRQGAKSRIRGIDDVELQYVGVSLANKFFPVKNIGIHAIIGPTININVGDNIFSDSEFIDFLFFGGVGYEFPFGLGVEMRYNIGLIDVLGTNFDYDDDYYDEDDDYFDDVVLNKVIQLGVTYKFDF